MEAFNKMNIIEKTEIIFDEFYKKVLKNPSCSVKGKTSAGVSSALKKNPPMDKVKRKELMRELRRGHLGKMSSKQAEDLIISDASKRGIVLSHNEAKEIREMVKGFTRTNFLNIRNYQSGKSVEIVIRDYIKVASKQIERFLEFTSSYDKPIFRGIKQSKEVVRVYSDLKVGSIIDMGGTSSWTSRFSMAQHWAKREKEGIVFMVKKPFKGNASVRHIAEIFTENEVLVSREIKFRVIKKPKIIKGITYINLEAIE